MVHRSLDTHGPNCSAPPYFATENFVFGNFLKLAKCWSTDESIPCRWIYALPPATVVGHFPCCLTWPLWVKMVGSSPRTPRVVLWESSHEVSTLNLLFYVLDTFSPKFIIFLFLKPREIC